jgi:hypothetical protein
MLGSRHGVDGTFLDHFGITKDEFLTAVAASLGEDAFVARWFLARPMAAPGAITFWNELAPQLGRPDRPSEIALRRGREREYAGCTDPRADSLFLLIAWDEGFLEETLAKTSRVRAKPRLLVEAEASR